VGEPGFYIVVKLSTFTTRILSAHLGKGGRVPLVYLVQKWLATFYLIINPLSTNSDQDQFSPNNIHTLSTDSL